jgi:hypothetical protein
MACCCSVTPFTCVQCRCQTSLPYEWSLSVSFDAGNRCFAGPSGSPSFNYGTLRPFSYSGSVTIRGRNPIFPGPCNYADGTVTNTTHSITATAYLQPLPGQAKCFIGVDIGIQQRHVVTITPCGSPITRTFLRTAALSGTLEIPGLQSPCIGSQYNIALSGNSSTPGFLTAFDVFCPDGSFFPDVYGYADVMCDNSAVTATATLTL